MTGRQELDTNVGTYDIVITGEQGNAKGIKGQFASVQLGQMDPLLFTLQDTYNLAKTHMAEELAGIKKDLAAAWEGDGAEKAKGVLDEFSNNVDSLRDNSYKIHMSLSTFRDKIADYKGQASGLDDDDDTGARSLYRQFLDRQNESLDAMPNSLYYWQPLSTNGGNQDTQIPGPGPAGPGPGIPGPGPGPGPSIPGTTGPSIPPYPSPSTTTDGPSTTTDGPSTYTGPGPGATISPYDPSSYGGGSTGGGAGGVGYDDGSSLAGAGGGPGPAGLGGGAGGLAGDGSLAGGGSGGGLGGGAGGLAGGGAGGLVGGGAGGGAGVGAGGGRGMMMPMHGGGGDDGDEERERNTWLEEDEDVWGGGDAPSGVIS